MDVSFISLKLILPAVCGAPEGDGQVACLVKPQFEAGREKVGKKGVVRDPAVHLEVLEQFLLACKGIGFTVLGVTYSPIRGTGGKYRISGLFAKGDPAGDRIGSEEAGGGITPDPEGAWRRAE
jgi:23S rRNA (cytidine1920-2'-O)/16S rRNA (cytidine1409-2'-O)-methyltransferase